MPFDPRGRVVPVVHLPHDQIADNRNWALTYLLSVDGPSTAAVVAARVALAELDPNLVLYRPHPLADDFTGEVEGERLVMFILAMFACVSLVLVVVGVYGVVARTVDGRLPEIGLSRAVGAGRRDVIGLIMREVVLPGNLGVGMGVILAVAFARALRPIVFAVEPIDPGSLVTFAAVALLTTALAGAMAASRRVSRLEPQAGLLRRTDP